MVMKNTVQLSEINNDISSEISFWLTDCEIENEIWFGSIIDLPGLAFITFVEKDDMLMFILKFGEHLV